MRVLHVTRDFPPHRAGGISTAVGGMVRASLGAGLGLAVVSFDAWRPGSRRPDSAPPESRGVRARCLPADEADPRCALFRVRTHDDLRPARVFALDFRPDVLHLHHGTLWPFAASLREALGVPIVKTVHVVQRVLLELRGSAERNASLIGQEETLALVDAVIAPSHAAAAALLRFHPSVARRLRIAGLGVDDNERARAAAAGAWARDRQTVLYVGRFSDVKGTHDLLAALPAILAEAPEAELVLAGGLPANRPAERRWIERWKRDVPRAARQRVRFTGWLSSEEVSAWYARAAVLAVPSRFETFGLAALEGMLHGAPVAATSAGALVELIEHERTGRLSAPGDVPALARNISALLADRAMAARLGGAAAADARRARLWPDVLPAIAEVYRDVLDAGRLNRGNSLGPRRGPCQDADDDRTRRAGSEPEGGHP